MPSRRQILYLAAAAPMASLVGCGGSDDVAATDCSPIELHGGHDCHVCGMTVLNHPGPKGQACLRDGQVLTFCSTRDLLSWAWQPESAPIISALFVHDLSRTDWDQSSANAWMDPEQALYVVGHDLRGAMGHSPASFSERADADAFASRHGGQVLAFDDLDWDTLRTESGDNGHA